MKLNYKWISAIALIIIIGVSGGIYYFSTRNKGEELLLSTTTSVRDTGLLDQLITRFEAQNSITVRYTAVGTGHAIDLAKEGQVDAVLVHAPALEMQFVNDGYGMNRTTLWYNYFIVAGPSSDPANVLNASNVTNAFLAIKAAGEQGKANFYSRGDNSGTDIKEKYIWSLLNLNTTTFGNWYISTGQGMAATITQANNDPKGYVLTDIGTFAEQKAQPTANIVLSQLFNKEDTITYNTYSYIVVNPNKFGSSFKFNTNNAFKFLEFLKSQSTIDFVRNYKVGNITLFNPLNG